MVTIGELLTVGGTDWLHIGGKVRAPGWKILDAIPADHVDIVADLRDLTAIGDSAFDAVYASHVLEHLSHRGELESVTRALHRILRVGGKLFVSVPDMDILSRLFSSDTISPGDKFAVMVKMFGGQSDKFDYHTIGLNQQFLMDYLFLGGFRDAYKVPAFGFFPDASSATVAGVPFSLNVVAIKTA
ncbi:MAG: methyltransferase domain-containing protein [Proteobacteria bacterium]|jgi:predicted SAM-dependent methyltransferase|nr:methyltransferase domain-containing protein [Pseudomonadota bacterium]NBT94195.1 methyltransferase domain-containing protein [Chloroflexota bacterium]NBQ61353.1 methyltransferase domain-containing protein [Pseudomonadota bacterium]NBT04091.1 methyltransferase domain-containing protein [Pseudomonadota bacterium]NBT18966.1 methyltransferase domain-containing protein [Pseudomonadota bacterium]